MTYVRRLLTLIGVSTSHPLAFCKLDELLRVDAKASSDPTTVGRQELEEIERHRSRARGAT